MNQPINVMVVEDSKDDALLMVRELQRAGYDPRYERVETAEALSVALAREHWDLVLSDFTMPHFRGTDALEILRKTGLDIPFIFVSGTLGEDAAVSAMKAGAHDYMRKDNLKRLIPAVERELREAKMRRQQKALEERSRRNHERVRALNDINLAINSTLDLQTILNLLLDKLDLFLPQPAVSNIALFNGKKGQLELVAWKNLTERDWRTAADGMLASLSWEVFQSKAPLLKRNVQTDPRWHITNLFSEHRPISYLGLPLIGKAEPLGTLSSYTGNDYEFSDDEIEFLSTVAGQAAIAIEKAGLYQTLKKQAEELERADKVKTEFLTVTSHELRTPLTTIVGYTSTMREGLLGVINSKQEKALGRVLRSANDLLAMINSILYAARLEGEAIVANKQDVDLWDLFEEIRSVYALPLGKDLTLIWDIPTELPYIRTDFEKLKHIVENLINNAIKFTKQGTITISLRCLLETSTLQFRISDNGPGIPKENLPFIFEMFRQTGTQESVPYSGMGLGLYIVKRFTELLEGMVAVDTENGAGTTFTVTVPYEEVPPAKIIVRTKKVPEPSFDDDRIRGRYEREIYEAVFRAFLGLEIDAMVAVDGKGQVVFINDQVVKMFGYSRDELIGRSVAILLPERLHKAHAWYLRSYISNPGGRRFGAGLNLTGRRKDGTEFPAELSLRPMITESGLVVVSIIRDLTTITSLEMDLEQKTKWLSLLNELSASSSQLPDLDLFLQDFLSKLHELIKYQAGRIFILDEGRKELRLRASRNIPGQPNRRFTIGEGIVGRVGEKGDAIVFESVDRNIEAHRLGRRELALVDGFKAYACFPIKVRGKVAGVLNLIDRKARRFNSQELNLIGAVSDQIGLVIDSANLCQELKQRSAEISALLKTNRSLASLSDRQAVLSEIANQARKIVDVEYAACHLWEKDRLVRVALAVERQSFGNRGVLEIEERLSGRAVSENRTIIVEDILQEPLVGAEYEKKLKNIGGRSFVGVPLRLGGHAVGVLSLFSAKKRRFSTMEIDLISTLADQAAIAVHHANFYAIIREKTLELEKVASARDTFLGVVSHEFRTPLSVIIGFASLMGERVLGEINQEQESALRKILRNSWELLVEIDNVLRTVAIEAGDHTVIAYEVSLNDIIDELKSTVTLPSDKDLKLTWEISSQPVTIKTDVQKLKQIMVNLIHNAIKFTEKGNVTVSASWLPDTQKIQFKVGCAGIELGEESLDAIFVKFQQLSSSQNRPYGGVGLGLYVLKKYSELLRGTVEVKSELAKGSTFILTIPIDIKEAVA